MDDTHPGWYPDPADAGRSRYWDGSSWTSHVSTGWGAAPGPQEDFGKYAPTTEELTGSGMRRVPQLFDDVGRILKRAWWPIVAVSSVIWAVWLVVALLVTAVVIDVGRAATAVTLMVDTAQRFPEGRWPVAAQRAVEEAFTGVLRLPSVGWLTAAAVTLAVLALLASCIQIAAVTRFGADAAAGLTVSWRSGWQAGGRGGLRLLGYGLALAAVVVAAVAVLTAATVAAAAVHAALAVVVALIGFATLVMAGVWLTGRLVPVLVQVDMGCGALAWTWRSTRGRFWAVLGRYVLWSIVASVVAQTVLALLLLPVSLVTFSAASAPDAGSVTTSLVLYLVGLPLSFVVAALTYIGVVPIWRDLTEDPRYRSIGADGRPVC